MPIPEDERLTFEYVCGELRDVRRRLGPYTTSEFAHRNADLAEVSRLFARVLDVLLASVIKDEKSGS
jgi:hypothetical protein